MGKSMTPELFFQAFVQGNYEDFKEHPDCVRRGFNAALSAYHMREQYRIYYQKNYPSKFKFKNEIEHNEYTIKSTNGYYKDIRDIANAYKHLYLKDADISSTGAIESIFINDDDANISEVTTNYDGKNYSVMYSKRSGGKYVLMTALECIINFWEKELEESSDPIEIIQPGE